MPRVNYTKRYVFSAEEISNILVDYVRRAYGLDTSEPVDVSVQWNIRKVANENDITLTIEPNQERHE